MELEWNGSVFYVYVFFAVVMSNNGVCFKTDLATLKSQWDREGVGVRNAFEHHEDMVDAANNTETFTDIRVPSRTSQCLPESHPITRGVHSDEAFNRLYEHLHGYPLMNDHFPTEYRVYGEVPEACNRTAIWSCLIVRKRRWSTRRTTTPTLSSTGRTVRQTAQLFTSTQRRGAREGEWPCPRCHTFDSRNKRHCQIFRARPGSVPNNALRIQKEMCPEA